MRSSRSGKLPAAPLARGECAEHILFYVLFPFQMESCMLYWTATENTKKKRFEKWNCYIEVHGTMMWL